MKDIVASLKNLADAALTPEQELTEYLVTLCQLEGQNGTSYLSTYERQVGEEFKASGLTLHKYVESEISKALEEAKIKSVQACFNRVRGNKPERLNPEPAQVAWDSGFDYALNLIHSIQTLPSNT